jgi:hypothetical protein
LGDFEKLETLRLLRAAGRSSGGDNDGKEEEVEGGMNEMERRG